MKNIILVFAFLITSPSILAQESTYQPLVREGVRWYYGYYVNPEVGDGIYDSQCYYEFKGDSVINGNVYKKLYRTVIKGDFFDPEVSGKQLPVTTLECCMIEKDKVVYAVYEHPDQVDYMDNRFMGFPHEGIKTEYGIKLYDFNQSLESITGHATIQGVKCNQYDTKFYYEADDFVTLKLIEGFGYKNDDWILYCTLPYPYIPRPTCCKGWYFIQFTDTDGKVIFDPNKDVYSGINDIKAGTVKSDTGYYNLQGQAVDIKSAPAGIYIHNGKKIVVK